MAKEKRELVLYAKEYEEYEAQLRGKKPGEMAGESSKEKTRCALLAFMKILSKNGRLWPNESDYSEYAEGKPESKATQQNEARVRSFFAWLEKRRENDTPMEENTVQQGLFGAEISQASEEPEAEMLPCVDDGANTEITAPNESESLPEGEAITENEPLPLPEPVKNKRGRKRLDDNGEIRKNKITVYLTDTQNADFTALISLKHARSATDYVLGLITAEISKNEKALYFFHEAEKYTS